MIRKALAERYLERTQGPEDTLHGRFVRLEASLGADNGGQLAFSMGKIGRQAIELAHEFYDLGIIGDFNKAAVQVWGAVPVNLAQQKLASGAGAEAPSGDRAILAKVAALRETIRQQRDHAVSVWQACAPKVEEGEKAARTAFGKYTEQLKKGDANAD